MPIELAELRNGVVIRCSFDSGSAWLEVVRAPQASSRVLIAEWRGGIGGVELVVSPDERFLAVFLFSGQGTQGYELFGLEPLGRIGGLPETRGCGSAPSFSPDSQYLLSLIDEVLPRLRATGASFEECQDDDSDERAVVDLAHLFVHLLSSPAVVHRFAVGIELPLSTGVDALLDWDRYDTIAFRGGELALRLPSGPGLTSEVHRIPLPPAADITVIQR
jgi:hypothetical protein